ncbi:MAG: NADH-quinone oxidoreductase subunit N, partial [Pseudomonadota bacterium]|nr:NADH-quinone oxidoreductase subunit N [Pseudomonadota bacterium]
MMTPALQTQLLASAPLLVMAAGIVAVMLLLSVARAHRTVVRLTTFIFIVGFGSCLLSLPSTEVTPLLVMDDYARFVMALLLVAGGLTALMVYGYLGEYAGYREEMYLLLLIATFGAMVLAGAQHAVSLLIGLETLGMALLGMIAYPMRRQRPLEASVKYLILSAAATAVMLFGFALVYAASGSMQFAGVAAAQPKLVGDDAM